MTALKGIKEFVNDLQTQESVHMKFEKNPEEVLKNYPGINPSVRAELLEAAGKGGKALEDRISKIMFAM